METFIQWSSFILFGILLFWCFLKPPLKDWIIVFFLKGFLSGFVDSFIIAYHLIEYPVRPLARVFQISVLFDLWVFPTLCVLYNQTSYRSNLFGIVTQAILYSIPMTLFESWLQRNTDLIKYHHWSWFLTFLFLVMTFLLVRGALGLIRKLSSNMNKGD